MKHLAKFLLFWLPLIMLCGCTNTTIKVSELKTEGLDNPIGIDRVEPSLSWIMKSQVRGDRQTAYRVLVASNPENLDKNTGDLWDSKKVDSEQSVDILYNGVILDCGDEAFWKVQVWDSRGVASPWSPVARWSMGPLKQDDWKARWIGLDKAMGGDRPDQRKRVLSARYLRKEFIIDKEVKRATAYIVGLGLYELYLNGEKVGDHVLSPGLTEYDKRAFYITYDVTDMVSKGTNTAGTILGNGRFFAPRLKRDFGYPKMLLQITLCFEDGSKEDIISDESWKITANGPIVKNNEYDGEFYDARKEMPGWNQNGFDDSGWMQAELVKEPCEILSAQMTQPIRITGVIKPVALTNPQPGVWIYDMGQNMVGWTTLQVQAEAGTRITQRFAETLKDDGTLYLDNIRGAEVTDTYIAKGEWIESYSPRFTYHGFRYVELTGFPGIPDLSNIEGKVVNDDLNMAGSFECSNDLINRIHRNAYWGIRGNYRSIPTDCPQRDERQGWLGDRSAGSRGESYIFDIDNLYSKWLVDIFDTQRESGSISDVCPSYWTLYNDNVTWAGTPIWLVKMLYDQYGDQQVVEQSYAPMKKWVDYMIASYMVDDIMPRDTYGDWCVPPIDPKLIHTKDPTRLTAHDYIGTSYFAHDLKLMAGYAAILGKTDDEDYFNKLYLRMKSTFHKKFFNEQTQQYSNNSATANILALAFDLVPEPYKQVVFNNLVEKIEVEHHAHITTGLIGQQLFNRILTDYGRADLAYRVNTQMDYPGYGYMIGNGATTIWELWNGNTADPAMNSGNHVMLLGDFLVWLYEDLAGIKPDTDNPGFKHIIMRPVLIESLEYVKASHESPYGLIRSEWTRKAGSFYWQIKIPVNATATIYLPVKEVPEIFENDKTYLPPEGKTYQGVCEIELGSGNYHFISHL